MFRTGKAVIGMIHVPALPGAPRCSMNFEKIRQFVLADSAALAEGGVDGLMIENFGDVPFYASRVPAHTVAFLSTLAFEIKTRFLLPLGINVLRNDGISAIAIAAAVGAEFVRVNVYTGARLADQGILQGEAQEITRYRRALGITAQIWADVAVKHSAALGDRSLGHEVEDTVERGLADAVIVSGTSTGKPTALEDVRTVKSHAGGAAVYVGSGVDESTVETLLEVADGAIVGTAFKLGGEVSAPVDRRRVSALVSIVRRRFTGERPASE
ncbi:MAG TPA: BtpA/SgcQ family protein [Bryobacteraceae bacterium]|nr:BtpA/SgcQ family protein [Bryobacteraceae bacterium]